MTGTASAWMPFYVGDYLGDTQRLTTEQHGAYLLLILDYWRSGPAPDDDAVLAQITRLPLAAWKRHRSAIARMFQVTDGEWRHKRIDHEISAAKDNAERRSSKARDGANAKWGESATGEHGRNLRSARLAAARAIATHTAIEWEHLKNICGHRCVRCGADETLVKDHIKPIYQGGSDGIDNIQPLCRSCNSSKGPEVEDCRPDGWQDALKMPAKMPARASAPPSPIPLDKSNGAEPDSDKVFWDGAKSFLSPESRNPGAIIGKWVREHGKQPTADALTRAQLERPVARIPFIEGCFRKQMANADWQSPC